MFEITPKKVALAAILTVAAITAACSYTVVPVGEEASVSSFGKVKTEKNLEGFNWIAPWWSIDVYNLQDRTRIYDDLEVASQDKFKTSIDVAYTGSYQEGFAGRTRHRTGVSSIFMQTHVDRRILSCITKGGGSVKDSQSFFELNVQEQLASYTLDCVNEYLDGVGGYRLSSVQLSDIRLDLKVKEFMVLTKERQEQENQAKSELATAETLAQKVVKTAEANERAAESNKRAREFNTDADFYAKQKEAEGNVLLSKSVTPELANYIKAQRWNGVMPTTMAGSSDLLIDTRGK